MTAGVVEEWYFNVTLNASCCREASVLLGENLGLQDVLTEAGADATAMAAQLAELEAQLERSQARVQEVHDFSLLYVSGSYVRSPEGFSLPPGRACLFFGTMFPVALCSQQ